MVQKDMFEKIKADNLGIRTKQGKLFFSYKLDNEDRKIKAAGRITLKKFPAGYDTDDEWVLDGDYLILAIKLKEGSDDVGLYLVKRVFEEMVS